ncbi:acetyl-coenzyme A transporter 1-domain-containing protein [Tribonema minus]|uniref:Acetyl-coenzyme A transporter 1-domain-containing protein n=1 Tax=Tribonema minus TaxID=303371 RepID=A0A836C8C4_9STRA|nr:acetyl-coenzyme A transporter 1-domain-containing protein [Tribonema minus]
MGLSGSIPLLLHNKVSYSQQALFSLVSLPFSLKLLWAPLVDSLYYKPFGRRKSWLVPVQMLCGLMMLGGAPYISGWMGDGPGGVAVAPDVTALTAYFLTLYAMMATQDIAVDGWALTMLSRENVGYASTCNSLGQTLGFFLAHVGFLALNDPGVCNRYFRAPGAASDVGIVTLPSFLVFWAIVFLATTLYVWFCRKERHDESEVETYRQLGRCIRLPSVQLLCGLLLTCKVAFAVTDAATSLKLVEFGMPKEELALMSPLLVALGMLIPVAVGRLTAGPKPLSVFLAGYPLRIAVTLVYAAVLPLARAVYAVPPQTGDRGTFYAALGGAVVLHEVASNFMYVSMMAFFARVSDPAIGGTYMTLLNTVSNLGTKWPNSLSLYLMDSLTERRCFPLGETGGTVLDGGAFDALCTAHETSEACAKLGGHCVVVRDGYNVQVQACVVAGVVWLVLCWRAVVKLQGLKQSEWHIAPGRDVAKVT